MACLTEPDEKIRLALLYQAKILRKNLDSELKARDAQRRKDKIQWIFPLIFSSSVSTIFCHFITTSIEIIISYNSQIKKVFTSPLLSLGRIDLLGGLLASLISFNAWESVDGRYDEDHSSCMFYSFETDWFVYRFHAWTRKRKCSRRY